ncbi:MAG: hypothetical protein Q9M26_02165 [Mariprofundales bacterium]|nr:hypothetical protein [Mariprofundales bacterium]
MMQRLTALTALILLAACTTNTIGLELTSGWQSKSLAVWRQIEPAAMATSKDRHYLYIACNNQADLESPSLYLYNLKSGRSSILINGLEHADVLKSAPDGSLWLGEGFDKGLIWRIAQPDKLPSDQLVERDKVRSSNPAISPLRRTGTFSHQGIDFSADGHYAYLPDNNRHGALYRYRLQPPHGLQVLGPKGAWIVIADPSQARAIAKQHHAPTFNHMEGMARLPNGHLLIAETDAPRILELIDHGTHAELRTYLDDPRIHHPTHLAWDARRNWLWITDNDTPAILWAWDGHSLQQIALHKHAEITGVLPLDRDILINLQGRNNGPEFTLRLHEEPLKS